MRKLSLPGAINTNSIGPGQFGFRCGLVVVMIMVVAVGATDRRTVNIAEDFAACHPAPTFSFKVNLQEEGGIKACMTRNFFFSKAPGQQLLRLQFRK